MCLSNRRLGHILHLIYLKVCAIQWKASSHGRSAWYLSQMVVLDSINRVLKLCYLYGYITHTHNSEVLENVNLDLEQCFSSSLFLTEFMPRTIVITRRVPLTVCAFASLMLLHDEHVSSVHSFSNSWDLHCLSGGSIESMVSPGVDILQNWLHFK